MWSGTLAELASRHDGGRVFSAEDFKPHLQRGFPWHEWQEPRGAVTADEWWQGMGPLFHAAFAEGGAFPDGDAALLASQVRTCYLRNEAWSLFDDVLPFFASPIAARYRHVILSNHVPELAGLLKGLGIAGFFEAIFNSALTGIEKPHAEAFQQVLRAYPDAGSCFMIGDSYRADIAGAEAVGITGVLVRRTDPRAGRCCPGLRELEDWLGGVLQGQRPVRYQPGPRGPGKGREEDEG